MFWRSLCLISQFEASLFQDHLLRAALRFLKFLTHNNAMSEEAEIFFQLAKVTSSKFPSLSYQFSNQKILLRRNETLRWRRIRTWSNTKLSRDTWQEDGNKLFYSREIRNRSRWVKKSKSWRLNQVKPLPLRLRLIRWSLKIRSMKAKDSEIRQGLPILPKLNQATLKSPPMIHGPENLF